MTEEEKKAVEAGNKEKLVDNKLTDENLEKVSGGHREPDPWGEKVWPSNCD